MSTTSIPRTQFDLGGGRSRRLPTETKAATKTTEFFVFVALVARGLAKSGSPDLGDV